jgi:cytochrome c oxidase subunit 4
MTEHAAEHHHEHADHDDHGHHDNSPEGIAREKRKYMVVFGALAVLTVITVLITRVHMPRPMAIAVALAIASLKASLVAAYFMHLINERRLIIGVLLLTTFFFGVLLWGPWHHRHDAEKDYPGYDVNANQPSPPPQKTGH